MKIEDNQPRKQAEIVEINEGSEHPIRTAATTVVNQATSHEIVSSHLFAKFADSPITSQEIVQ